jgi:hypothetical protein
MNPTVSRTELNETDDIIAERGLVPMRRRGSLNGSTSSGTPTSACDGKVPFLDKPAADQAASRYRGRTTYRCRFCRHWHVGGKLDR